MIGPFKIISIFYSLTISFCLFSIPLGNKSIFEHIHHFIAPAKKVVIKKSSEIIHQTYTEVKNIGTQLFSSSEPKIEPIKYSDKVRYQLSGSKKKEAKPNVHKIKELPERELDQISNEDRHQLKRILE
jgi:hypothetical protein